LKTICKDTSYTNEVITKWSLEKACKELRYISNWITHHRNNDSELLDYIKKRQDRLEEQVESKTITIEMMKRYAGEDRSKVRTGRGIHITDHAVVRYLERILGVDMTELAGEIVDEKNEKLIEGIKHGRLHTDYDGVLVFRNSTIITILTRVQHKKGFAPHKHKGKKGKQMRGLKT